MPRNRVEDRPKLQAPRRNPFSRARDVTDSRIEAQIVSIQSILRQSLGLTLPQGKNNNPLGNTGTQKNYFCLGVDALGDLAMTPNVVSGMPWELA